MLKDFRQNLELTMKIRLSTLAGFPVSSGKPRHLAKHEVRDREHNLRSHYVSKGKRGDKKGLWYLGEMHIPTSTVCSNTQSEKERLSAEKMTDTSETSNTNCLDDSPQFCFSPTL